MKTYTCELGGHLSHLSGVTVCADSAAGAAEDALLDVTRLAEQNIQDGDIVEVSVLDEKSGEEYTFYVEATIQFTVVDEPPA